VLVDIMTTEQYVVSHIQIGKVGEQLVGYFIIARYKIVTAGTKSYFLLD
jgi:hypothetical protein